MYDVVSLVAVRNYFTAVLYCLRRIHQLVKNYPTTIDTISPYNSKCFAPNTGVSAVVSCCTTHRRGMTDRKSYVRQDGYGQSQQVEPVCGRQLVLLYEHSTYSPSLLRCTGPPSPEAAGTPRGRPPHSSRLVHGGSPLSTNFPPSTGSPPSNCYRCRRHSRQGQGARKQEAVR